MAGGVATFGVELFCTEDKRLRRETIIFPAGPTTILNIKEKVEEQFGIPVCVQSLTYEAHHYLDSTDLEKAGIRAEDRVLVRYTSQGDCQLINDVVEWLKAVWEHLQLEPPTSSPQQSAKLRELFSVENDEEHLCKLAFEYFLPWLNARKHANKCHFIYNDGLKIMTKIYAALHQKPWNKSTRELQYMEWRINSVLWNLCETFDLRRSIVRCGGLNLCINSLLRQKLDWKMIVDGKYRPSYVILGAAGLLSK